jgi:NAD(P)-dependent dehydrogenase (short-subunit alcohol dehydrogenase family)
MAHRLGKIDFDNLNGEKSYRRWPVYGQSKLANLLFSYELQRRFNAAGIPVLAMAAHPGWASTNLQYAGAQMDGCRLMLKGNQVANALFAQSQRMGALPQLYALTAPDVEDGAYYGPDGFRGTRGYPVRANSTPRSHNQTDAARLWEVSEALTGVKYRF